MASGVNHKLRRFDLFLRAFLYAASRRSISDFGTSTIFFVNCRNFSNSDSVFCSLLIMEFWVIAIQIIFGCLRGVMLGNSLALVFLVFGFPVQRFSFGFACLQQVLATHPLEQSLKYNRQQILEKHILR